MRYHSPVAPTPMMLGQHIRLADDLNPWTVTAVTENFAVLTRQTTKQEVETAEWLADPDDKHWENPYEEGETVYTVLDWRNGVRGPCNLSGQGYGDGDYTEDECAQMLAEFEAGELEVSHRNQVPIRFGEVAW
jgi:hypothetical protein